MTLAAASTVQKTNRTCTGVPGSIDKMLYVHVPERQYSSKILQYTVMPAQFPMFLVFVIKYLTLGSSEKNKLYGT